MPDHHLHTLIDKLREYQAISDVEKEVENELLMYVTKDNRVCPKPPKWDGMYQLLPDQRRSIPPLILASWWETPDKDKQRRLKQQIEFARNHHVLLEVAEYLLNLSPDDWAYADV